MIPEGLRLSVFVSHTFSPRSEAYSLQEFRTAIEESLAKVAAATAGSSTRVRLLPTFETSDFSRPVGEQVIHAISSSDCAIVDITDVSPNVMYELGYLDALGTPAVLVRSRRSSAGVPVDLSGRMFVEYDTVDELSARLVPTLSGCVQASLRRYTILPNDRATVWFPGHVQNIHIVVGHSPDNLYSADPLHPNFIYIEQFSDKDTLLELVAFLSRTYKGGRIHKYTSRDFPQRQLLRENLVIVGGPGLEGMNNGNKFTVEMHRRMPSRLTYAPDGESATFRRDEGTQDLRPTYAPEGNLVIDYGYFARFPNPFEPDATVVMTHGMHTTGVLGAALAFSDRPQASSNFRILREALGATLNERSAFEILIEVERMAGEVLVPAISTSDVYWL